jgi:hypothetical protein
MRGGRVSMQQVAADSFGNAIGSSIVDAMQRAPDVPLPAAIATDAETNPAVAQLYRETVRNFQAGGIDDQKAQELAQRGFDLRGASNDPAVLDAYKEDVLIARGATRDGAKAFLNYLGLSTGYLQPAAVNADAAIGTTALALPLQTVEVTGSPDNWTSEAGKFLWDWQDELAAVGTASKQVSQWMDDHPMLGWGAMAIQAATTPLLFAGQQALAASPVGQALDELTGTAFEAAANFVDKEGAIGDQNKAALMTLGGIGALSLVAGGLGMLRQSMNSASMLARQLEQRRIELNFERDGGVDPHVVDPRILAQARLGQMQSRLSSLMSNGDAHFVERHGSQTTLAKQYERATTGWPNKNGVPVTDNASRFFNPEDMEQAIKLAMQDFHANPRKSVVVPMGKPIGEGFLEVTSPGALPDYRQSNVVRVNFDMQAGLPYTAFPDIVRNGVTLPVPKF